MKVLYISYDGMTDNLGQSQVLPYLIGLTARGYSFDIISCEKKDKFDQGQEYIREYLSKNEIEWYPVSYTKNPPVLSTIFDIIKISMQARKLHKEKSYNAVHCRSYIAALVGLSLKKKYNLKFIFDMRGFWADERVDGNLWNLKKNIYKFVYRYFKQKETDYLNNSDAIISLTNAGKKEMLKWNFSISQKERIKVIPCCADFEHFTILPQNKNIKHELGFAESDKVLGYLGSLGTWYMLDEMLELFKAINFENNSFKFLFITAEPEDLVYTKAISLGINPENIKVIFVKRSELPEYLSIIDIAVSFIKPSYSKLSSSPTKMGELFASGIPVICNSGVGDVEDYIYKTHGGSIISNFNNDEYKKMARNIDNLILIDKNMIRSNAYELFALEKGVDLYEEVYKNIELIA